METLKYKCFLLVIIRKGIIAIRNTKDASSITTYTASIREAKDYIDSLLND